MKSPLRVLPISFLLGAALLTPLHPFASAQAEPEKTAVGTSSSPAPKPEAENSDDQFRHAAPVQMLARALGMSTETAAQLFEDINSGILIFAILFFLMKFLPKTLRGRTATIQKQLVDARSATEAANSRLTAVEAKLASLGEEIEALRQQTERDSVEDEKRIKQSLEDERQRIVKSAEQEIESAGAAAQRGLKQFAANLAIEKAVQRIQLSAESDKAIVARFGQELTRQQPGKGSQN